MSKIGDKHPAYEKMAQKWPIMDALCGGTTTMRAAGTQFLPQEPRESNAAYQVRLKRTALFPALKETLKMLCGKPFQQDVTLKSDSADLLEMQSDVDMMGRNLTTFAKDVLTDAMKYGLSHIIVDFPTQPEGAPTDRASQRAANVRPYFVHVKAANLINWTTREVNGKIELESITTVENWWENSGHGQAVVTGYRVYTRDEVLTYTQTGKSKPELKSRVPHTFGEVPLVTVYANRTGFMTAEPPLVELAHTNITHWQSSSDQRNILRIARVPFLFATGLSAERGIDEQGNTTESEIDQIQDIGPNSLHATTNKDANLKWVEHSGASIAAGKQDLDDLKEEMISQGAQFLIPKRSNMTATEYSGNQASTQSDLQAVVGSLDGALETAFDFAAQWLQITEHDTSVEVFRDFNRNLNSGNDIDLLFKARDKGFITQQTFLNELKRRDILADGLVIEDEISQLEDEDAVLQSILGQNEAAA